MLLNLKTTKATASKGITYEVIDFKGSLHLRNLGFTTQDALDIAAILKKEDSFTSALNSFSLSYNNQMGDKGIIAIMNHLPMSVKEIGLVGCDINNPAGKAILEWMQTATSLHMICMEQNKFSNSLKKEFHNFKKENPSILVIL
ncbi:MAG: hypothetical protein ACI9V9_000302 [Oleispira sp.]|jgi:hypothetical protein